MLPASSEILIAGVIGHDGGVRARIFYGITGILDAAEKREHGF
jgi:hypothetical protein